MGADNLKIFLIDDDDDDKEIFQLALDSIDIESEFLTARDGHHALEILNNDPEYIPHYIFLDLNMPKINGWETLPKLRETERLNSVPVYIYTTSSNLKDQAKLLSIGATGYITKPVDIKDLIIILKSLFKSVTHQLANN